jgi:hypothetical protein
MKDQNTILLDIYERLGAIEANLKASARSEDAAKATTADHETRLKSLERFEGRVGAYIWLGGSIASGVLFFLWEGIKYGLEKLAHH